jgi:two-component system, NarL family, response regulator NreC
MQKIRILIVDNQTIVRVSLRMFLDAQPDMEVVGEAKDSRTALAKAREMQPDVTVMEICIPRTNGVKAIEQLRKECPQTRVVVLTLYEDQAHARSALAAGGSAYVVKRAAASDLLSAIRAVYRGHFFVDRTLAGPVLERFLEKATRRSVGSGRPRNLLSPRECEVIVLLAQGYTHRQVGEKIHVGVKTVETYRWRIAQKLALHSRAELVRYAHESGLLTSIRFLSGNDDRPVN